MRTLIVDDVLLLRHVLEKTLSKYGECDIAENGEEALEMFTVHFNRNTSYDLICLDLMMPGVSGMEVLRKVRGLENSRNFPPEDKCKIIIITSISDQSFVSKAITLGCDDYMVKPITPKMLIQKLIKLKLVPRGK